MPCTASCSTLCLDWMKFTVASSIMCGHTVFAFLCWLQQNTGKTPLETLNMGKHGQTTLKTLNMGTLLWKHKTFVYVP